MNSPDESPPSLFLDEEEPESGTPEPVSPFLDTRLQLGSFSQPIPDFNEENPVSLQVAAASAGARPTLRVPELASLLHRGAAKVIDWFLAALLYGGLVAFWASRIPFEQRSAAISVALFFVVPGLWLTWLVCNALLGGRTVGKRMCGLQVITDRGDPLGAGRNFGRIWAESLSWGLLFLGYLFAFLDRQKRTLHDHLCGTRVVLRRSL